MTESRREFERSLYRESLYEFVKKFWSTVDPSPYIDGVLVEFYCEIFEYMCRQWIHSKPKEFNIPEHPDDVDVIDIRGEKKKLNINVPPRHTKSMIFNVLAPVWLWLNYPIKVASISHRGNLASDMNGKRVKLINSDLFQFYYGDEIQLKVNSYGHLIDNRGAELYSCSRDAMTGSGADVIINDDLTNAETARRDGREMEAAWYYYQNTMPSRINDRNNYIIMNIQQRLAPNDITGRILAIPDLAEQYEFVVLPAIMSRKTVLVFPMSGKTYAFGKGECLWPQRFGDYEDLKIDVGNNVFETQYLQNPIDSDDTIIHEDMIHYQMMPEAPAMQDADMVYASHDFPVKDKDISDFLGSVLAYRVNSVLYIVDCLEKHMAFSRSVEYVEQLDTLYPGIIQIIEDTANGAPILQQLQDRVAGMQAYQPGSRDKSMRLESATLYMISKNVVFVKNKWDVDLGQWQYSPGVKNLINRLLMFPFVEHDDIVDAFSMLVLFVFMDKRYMVYGRSFTDENILKSEIICDHYTTFCNREGDKWKAVEIGVKYGVQTKLIVSREMMFRDTIDNALSRIQAFSEENKKNQSGVLIDCSASDSLMGMYTDKLTVEKYYVEDFDKSVSQLNLAFDKKIVLLSDKITHMKTDIENFKFSKQKDDTVRYASQKDGFAACLRVALTYFGV